jgi:hypothetical protein
MDRLIPIPPPRALVDGPFTRPMAAAVGVSRTALERMIRNGSVRRLLRGVYVDATRPESVALRARALALVVPPGAVAVDRTAGWLHGLHLDAALPAPTEAGLDVLGRSRPGTLRHLGAARPLAPRDVVRLGPVLATSPVRTALDLGRLLPHERGLAVLDAALRRGWCDQAALVVEVARVAGLPGGRRLRVLVGLADGRARTAAASVLRLRWLDAGLPTPVLHLAVPGAVHDVTLAVPAQRFGVVLGDATPLPGWEVVPIASRRVLHSDAVLVEEHLRREYHRHLLRRAG